MAKAPSQRRNDGWLETVSQSIASAVACPLGKQAESFRRFILLALLVAVVAVAAYGGVIVWLDNTITGTSNGLWKSVEVSAWSHGSGFPVDSGGMLYSAAYGRLSRLVPDWLAKYGMTASAADLTFRKMAFLNCLFGGIATGLIFLLAARFTGSALLAAAIACVHAGAGFVLVNSINSEDIIPAYALVLASVVCLFEFLYAGGVWLYVSSAMLLALATLFHWTVMIPALALFGIVFAILLFRRWPFLPLGLAWLAAFILSVRLWLLVTFPDRAILIGDVLYPKKAEGGGWVGLLASKKWYSLVGMGSYFAGGFNVSNYRVPFENPSLLAMMIFTWTLLVLAVGGCLAAICLRRVAIGLKLLAAAALAVFLAGEGEAIYSQPQDPQMQIEPMWVVIAGIILLAAVVPWRRSLAGVLLVLAIANGYWNIHLLSAKGRGGDSRAAAGIRQLSQLFPKESTVIVSQGFESWTSWHFVLLQYPSFGVYAERNVLLTSPFVLSQGISPDDAAKFVEKQIDAAFASGKRVVADSVWTDPLEQSAASFSTVIEVSTARKFLSILKERYRMGTRWETMDGPFVEIQPPAPSL